MRALKSITLAVAMSAFCAVHSLPSQAMPASGGSDATAPENAKPAKKPTLKKLACKRGETAKLIKSNGKSKYACVKLKVGVLPQDELYQQARALADAGEYEWALDHLRAIENQNDPEVLNYTGYSNRKAGRLETGIGYYYKALAINPDYVEARSYLGQAYALAGKRDLAIEQLQEIKARCGTECEAFVKLKNTLLSQ
jgi:tetratricopeptide (TPR) repeat protein